MPAILLLIALLAAGQIETGEACRKKMDLCFIHDSSSTVCGGGDEPCENWETILQFSKIVTNTLDIGSTLDRVALMKFTNSCNVEWNLRQYTAMNPLLSAIGGVAYEGSEFTDLTSVNVLVTGVFSPPAGDDVDQPLKPARKNVILMITDGVPFINETEGEMASRAVQQYGVTFFLVCITSGACTESWAKAIASKPEKDGLKTYFLVDSYPSLDIAFRNTVMEQICYFLEDPPLLPTVTLPPVKINLNLTVG